MQINLHSPIEATPRVLQVAGMFDLKLSPTSSLSWEVNLPLEEKHWNIGLIVGPSGCGKSTVARHRWPDHYHGPHHNLTWPEGQSLLDAFPEDLPIKAVVELLSSVGFSSPPAWLRPFHALSTGQQFRATLARLLAESMVKRQPLVVLDEFTSVVDRTVAQIGSAALAKTVRSHKLRFVAVTCHEDVEPWLQPDWIYRPAEDTFAWRSLQRQPPIHLKIVRCKASAWPLFAHHHYLSHSHVTASTCFLATWHDKPVAYSSWITHAGPSKRGIRREHRTVTLPDYQGVGIGNALSNWVAALWAALGYKATSTTTHPAMIRARQNSGLWQMHRAPQMARSGDLSRMKRATTRMTASFTYMGPPAPYPLAQAFLRA
jgi:GNAT superfamily N-acetyltransferase